MAARSSSGSIIAIVVLTLFTVGFFVGFIVFLARAQNLQTELAQARTDYAQIISPAERNNDAVQNLLAQASQNRGQTLVKYLSDSLNTTMRRVAGNERETAASLSTKLDGIPGADASPLLSVLNSRDQQIASLKAQLDDANRAAAAAQQDLQNEVERVKTLLNDHQTTIAGLNEQVGKYKAEVEALRASTTSTIADNNKRVDDIRQRAAAEAASLSDRINKISAQNQILEGQLSAFREQAQSDLVKPEDEAARVDARVVSVSPAENLIFIDRSRADRLVLGMTFEVYDSPASIRPDKDGNYPRGKASIEIVRIGNDSSAARVIREISGNPIVPGDVLANAIYDPHKVYNFVVAGDFDLNRDGAVSEAERSEVTAIINNWGGRVTDDIAGNTDFLVLGSRPNLPPQPPPDAPIAVIQEYIRLQRAASEYDRLFDTARQTGIPVLNQSRLTTLTGLR
ncbi:MAG: hypothetical protein AB7G17_11900 [Phycisphaerales bacterium]